MKTTTALLALSLLLLTGCTPTSTPTPPERDSAGGEAVPPCLVGEWDLDLAHYQDDVEFFAEQSGLPLESLALSGTQLLTFSADGQVTLGTDLTADASVPGLPRPLSSTNTNFGIGSWSTEGSTTLTITDFSFTFSEVVPSEPGAPSFGGCDFTEVPVADFVCEEDSLFIIGPEAPYGSYWTRR
jgi:hypothetical protein